MAGQNHKKHPSMDRTTQTLPSAKELEAVSQTTP